MPRLPTGNVHGKNYEGHRSVDPFKKRYIVRETVKVMLPGSAKQIATICSGPHPRLSANNQVEYYYVVKIDNSVHQIDAGSIEKNSP